MRAKRIDENHASEPAAAGAGTNDGPVAVLGHAVEDVRDGLLGAGEKLREATVKGAHDIAKGAEDAGEKVREVAGSAGHAAAGAKDTVAERAHGGAVAIRTHRRHVGAAASAAASVAFAVVAALLARRRRPRA